MKRKDRIKLSFSRNWNLPGKERLAHWFKPSQQLKTDLRDGIIWLNTEDIAIYTTADNYIEWTILTTGTYEDDIGKIIKISLAPGDVALDIGGNIGLQSLRMALRTGPTGKIYAFEPLTYLQQKFEKNMQLNRVTQVTLLPYALSDKESEAEFKIDRTNWNQGTFSLNNDTGTETQRVIVKVADNLPEIQQLEKLALIKIDVEGFEFEVLKGLQKTLKKHSPRIIFEYDDNYWRKNGQSIADCYQYLKNLNYTVYQMDTVSCELINKAEDVKGGNLLCIAQ